MEHRRRAGLKKAFKYYSNVVLSEIIEELEEELKKGKRLWARQWLLRRDTIGNSAQLLTELATEDHKEFRSFMRMTCDQFNVLLQKVTPEIQRTDTNMRGAIPAKIKLEVTLSFLATGNSYRSLSHFFRVSKPAISKFIPEVLDAIHRQLLDYVKVFVALVCISLAGVCYGQNAGGTTAAASGGVTATGNTHPFDLSSFRAMIGSGISGTRQAVTPGITQAQQQAAAVLTGIREAHSALSSVKSDLLQQGTQRWQEGLRAAANATSSIPLFGAAISQGLQTGAQVTGSIGNAIENKQQMISSVKSNMLGAAQTQVAQGFGALQAGANMSFDLAERKADAVVNGISSLANLVGSFASAGQQAAQGAAQAVTAAVSNAAQTGAASLSNAVQNGAAAVTNAVQNGADAVTNAVQNGAAAVTNAAQTGAAAATNAAQTGAAAATNAAQNGAAAVTDAAQTGAAAETNAAQTGAAAVTNAAQTGAAAATNAAQTGAAAVTNAAQTGAAAVTNAAQTGAAAVTNVAQTGAAAVTNVAQTGAAAVNNAVQAASQAAAASSAGTTARDPTKYIWSTQPSL